MKTFELIQEQKRHLRRLKNQIDALTRLHDGNAAQLDKLAAETEQTQIVLTLLELDRTPRIDAPKPLKMEFV